MLNATAPSTPTLPRVGTCFGFEVHSELPLRYVRGGSGADGPLEVVAGGPEPTVGPLLREWNPPAYPVPVRLHAGEPGYALWVEGAGWFAIDPDVPRIRVPADGDPVRREERLWAFPTLLCLLHRGDLPLHAAAVQVDDTAVVLAGPGRHGKTTLAAACAQAGLRVLAEDLTCLRLDGGLSVVPGPAMLRVRHDVADHVDVAGAAPLARDDDRVHLSLDRDRGTCDPVPVAALALLRDGQGPPRLQPAPPMDALRDLWALTFNFATDEDRSRCFAEVAQASSAAPVFDLTRRLVPEDLPATVDAIVGAARGR